MLLGQQADSRAPAPSEETQAKARQLVEQLFERELAAARKPQEKAALARKLMEEAGKAKDDPAGRFVLLTEARELAVQAGNRHWQWYVEQLGGPLSTGGYIGFIRGQLPKVTAKAPDDLPASRLFEGTGQAYLNSQIKDATQSVQVVLKASPFGTQSHGYESNNSFLLWAYGKRLLIYSGYRDIYGSEHHTNWMWTTRSTNCITVNGKGQKKQGHNGHLP